MKIEDRMNALQQELIKNNVDYYYLNTSDYHSSEYVAEYFRTIEYFTGFTGSLATLIISKNDAHIFIDGRYHIQADNQAGAHGIIVEKLGVQGVLDPISYLKENAKGKVIGLDGKRTTTEFSTALEQYGLKIKSIDLYSNLIENRAPLKDDQIYRLEEKYTGKSRKDKIKDILYCLDGKTHIINNLESIAYVLNLRANDIVHTPVFYSYMIFYQNDCYLFLDIKRLDPIMIDELFQDGVVIKPYNEYYEFLKQIKNQKIVLDKAKVNYETYIRIKDNNELFYMRSIVEEMKARKNAIEAQNAKQAHIKDGVTMVRFLKWLSEVDKTKITEKDAANYLDNLRLTSDAFDLSFNTIAGYNANAAMMHYSPSNDKPVYLSNEGILLVDSGGQYKEGTTDITRTIALGKVSDELKKHFTLVLKSMFNLSSVKFLRGMAGNQLDILARRNLWEIGIDYRCGTGHGVGHVLSVHENPPNIRWSNNPNGTENAPIEAGHIFSDEPGVYLEGKYGIRCENMLLCVNDELNEYGQFLRFETITLCPFDLSLIDKNYLDEKTIKLLNDYHEDVYRKLSPYLNEEEKEFLKQQTRSI